MNNNVNLFYRRYCDGSSFAGNSEITSSNGMKIYFKGRSIRDAVIQSLIFEHGMHNASFVIIAGCSAGALAVYLGIDEIAERIRRQSRQFNVIY